MRRIILSFTLLLLSLAAWAGQTWQLTILHTNDLHGMLLPHTYQREERGGLARRATMIKEIRGQVTHALALIDTGDIFARGPWHTKFFGMPEVEAMNAMGYDMMCVGNNDFKATEGIDAQDKMLALVRHSRFPWLAANLTVGETGNMVEGMRPYLVRDFGGVRVGFLGLTSLKPKQYTQTKGLTFSDPVKTASHWVPIVRKECDILIAVTHQGVHVDTTIPTPDVQLARKVPGIDAIIGGDSHTFLEKPVEVQGPDGRTVPIFQAGEQGVVLGRADLTFERTDAGWRLTTFAGTLMPVAKTVPDDPAIKQLLDRWLAPQPAALLPLGVRAWAA